MTAEAHAAAVLELIGDVVRVFEGDVPKGAVLPYAALYIDDGLAQRTRLVPTSDRLQVTVQVTSVGLDAAGARGTAQRVRDALLDKRPAVAGRASTPIAQDAAEPLRVDRDVTPHRPYVVDVYSFSTMPTTA